ncbi:hypothetical protein CDL15_Pgr007970 [Punica granatum]|uniref:Uncharacterized protein n=1 Tax=Punica granatum TaxID=22663 RepID=A0A218XBP4_PUNGR|nr:hypothetical protein CDL15_Pgr007970 [Punica granatum]
MISLRRSSPSSPDPNRALSTSTTTPSPASSPPRRPPGFVLTPPLDLPLPPPRSQQSIASSNVIRERVKLGDAKSRNARVEQPAKVQYRGAGLGQRKSFYNSTDFFLEPTKRSASIFEDIDRRLRIRGIDEPSKDLETVARRARVGGGRWQMQSRRGRCPRFSPSRSIWADVNPIKHSRTDLRRSKNR